MLPIIGVQAGISVTTDLTKKHIVQIGQHSEGTIEITNLTQQRTEVKLYQTDYHFSADGRNYYGEPGKSSRSNATWLRIFPQRAIIPPKGVIHVQYKIKVPYSTRLRGSYWSIIMIEEITETSAESQLKRSKKPTVALGQVIRYGVQIITDIGNSGQRLLKFENLKLLKTENQKTLAVDIKNIGERWLRPQIKLNLFNQQGQLVKQVNEKKIRLYPKTSARFLINLGHLRKGKYRALLIADAAGNDVFGINFQLVIK